MAFSLTKFNAFTVIPDSASRTRALQFVSFEISRGAADVAIDLNDSAGTFWTAAIADATYGPLATRAQAVLAAIFIAAKTLVSCQISSAAGFHVPIQPGGTLAAATEYKLLNDATWPAIAPEITLHAAASPATLKVELVLALADDKTGFDSLS